MPIRPAVYLSIRLTLSLSEVSSWISEDEPCVVCVVPACKKSDRRPATRTNHQLRTDCRAVNISGKDALFLCPRVRHSNCVYEVYSDERRRWEWIGRIGPGLTCNLH